jgi:hypothetical protein
VVAAGKREMFRNEGFSPIERLACGASLFMRLEKQIARS